MLWPGAWAFDVAGITNTVGMMHAKIAKGGPPTYRIKPVEFSTHAPVACQSETCFTNSCNDSLT